MDVRRRAPRLLLTAAGALLALALTPAPGLASARDTTGPQLRVGPQAAFAVGSQVEDFDMAGTAARADDYTSVPHALRWSASDPSGICGYDLDRVYAGQGPRRVLSGSQQSTFQDELDDYNGDFGGGSLEQIGWRLTAHDCAGNQTRTTFGSAPLVVQEDGTSPVAATVPVRYSGTWTRSSCTCASDGAQRFTSAPGARVAFRHSYRVGDYAGLVMARGPQRGRADVYVDGVRVATVDSTAPANTNRTVVFNRLMTAGVHTLEVVNQGTAGHPRIDVDAFLTS